eukprot:TRINITY_DN5633_c0_g1_i2.p1 TRINITY_DN5633_c0_g1~~TRINITY_DN5633_c0_g1_i2.p1  ORF type:complete len:2844 (+),score=463.56 TRINITY_DN5633_c0_g1_i2:55-8586(+)
MSKHKSTQRASLAASVCEGNRSEDQSDGACTCPHLFIESDKADIMDVRAVKYDPRPLYGRLTLDPYIQNFLQFHQRDLTLMKESGKINTVMLNPWDPQSTHRKFLETCLDLSLKVIPAFNISWYWNLGACGTELCQGVADQLETDFTIFLHQASDEDTQRNWKVHPAVMMWNIVGLPELERLFRTDGCVEPDMSAYIQPLKSCARPNDDASGTWQLGTVLVIQEVLATIKKAQQKFYCESKDGISEDDGPCHLQGDTFRPILLTIGIGKDVNLQVSSTRSYIAQSIFWMERVIGCNHLSDQVQVPTSLQDIGVSCANEGNGFFDAWNIRITSSSDKMSVGGLKTFLQEGFPRPNSLKFSPDLTFEMMGGPMKPTLFEYGFADVDSENNSLDILYHQRLLQHVEDVYKQSIHNGSCLSGTVIDEWMSHEDPEGVKGIVSQFDANVMHCIDPPPWGPWASIPAELHLCVSIGWTSSLLWIVLFVLISFCIQAPVKAMCKWNLWSCKCCKCWRSDKVSPESNGSERKTLERKSTVEFMKSNPDMKDKFANLSDDAYGKELAEKVADKLMGLAWEDLAWALDNFGSWTDELQEKLRSKGQEKDEYIVLKANSHGTEDVTVQRKDSKKDFEIKIGSSEFKPGQQDFPLRFYKKGSKRRPETFPKKEDLKLIAGHAGWGLQYIKARSEYRFEYCRVKEGGLGFVSPEMDVRHDKQDGVVPRFWTTRSKFVEWLAAMTDQEFAVYGFKEVELNSVQMVANRTINKKSLQLLTQVPDPYEVTVVEQIYTHCCEFTLKVKVKLKADDFFLDSATTLPEEFTVALLADDNLDVLVQKELADGLKRQPREAMEEAIQILGQEAKDWIMKHWGDGNKHDLDELRQQASRLDMNYYESCIGFRHRSKAKEEEAHKGEVPEEEEEASGQEARPQEDASKAEEAEAEAKAPFKELLAAGVQAEDWIKSTNCLGDTKNQVLDELRQHFLGADYYASCIGFRHRVIRADWRKQIQRKRKLMSWDDSRHHLIKEGQIQVFGKSNASGSSTDVKQSPKFEIEWQEGSDHTLPFLLKPEPESADFPLTFKLINDQMQQKEEIEHYMSVYTRAHLRAQSKRLEAQVCHEMQFIMTAVEEPSDTSRPEEQSSPKVHDQIKTKAALLAMRNVRKRVLEGCLICKAQLLCGQEDNDEEVPFQKLFQKLFCEALLLRFLESAGEHLMHCPEYLAWVYFSSLKTLKQESATWKVEINFHHLFEPLQELSRNMNVFNGRAQGISLDDINDAGVARLARMRTDPSEKVLEITKQWKEPIGYWVVVNVIANHGKVFRLLYLLALAAFAYGDRFCEHGFNGAFDSFVCTVHLNYRLGPSWNQFTLFNGMTIDSFVLLAIFCCESFVSDPWTVNGHKFFGCRVPDRLARHRELGRILLRGLGCLILSALSAFCVATYVDQGEEFIVDFIGASDLGMIKDNLATGYFICCAVHVLDTSVKHIRGYTSYLQGRENEATESVNQMNYKGAFVTVVILALNLVLCILMLYPLARPVDVWTLCTDVCEPHTAPVSHRFCLGYVSPFNEICIDQPWIVSSLVNSDMCTKLNSELNVNGDSDWSCHYSTQCLACLSVFGHVWLLLSLGIIVTVFFVYYAMVGIVGAAIGFSRGLGSTELDVLSFVEAPAVKSSSDKDFKLVEARQLSEGGIMQRVFGSKWKQIWQLIVESLHEESLVDTKAMKQLIDAAETNKEVSLTNPGGIMQDLARYRIDFLFKSFRQILSEEVRHSAHKRCCQKISESMKMCCGLEQDESDTVDKHFMPYYDSMDHWSKKLAEQTSASSTDVPAEHQPSHEERLRKTDALAEVYRKHCAGMLPSLTQIIPVFGELGLYSMEELKKREGQQPTLLEFLISQFKEEWHILAEQLGQSPSDLYKAVMSLEPADFEKRYPLMHAKLLEWASFRHQTVYRTVDGAVNYHKALELLLKHPHPLETDEKSPKGRGSVRNQLIPHVQLLLSHQTYGKKKRDEKNPNREKDVNFMLEKYRRYPLFLVIDYDAENAVKDLRELVNEWCGNEWCEKGLNCRVIRYASLLAEYDAAKHKRDKKEEEHDRDKKENKQMDKGKKPEPRLPIKLLHVLPRIRPLRLVDGGGSKLATQGKAANQLNAMRFATGHYLQMMDANMGCFLGETLKVPHVLRKFRTPAKLKPSNSDISDKRVKKSSDTGMLPSATVVPAPEEGAAKAPAEFDANPAVTMRVIGFREYVFTRSHGLMGKITADAEWTFGTATQRFLAFMGVRMHYGHPDFVDAFWAANRGSVSKASPINLSEDIFFGFNVNMRNEISDHTDILEWEKGREVQFLGAAGLFWKFSSGNVGVMRSRDLRVLCMSASHLYSVPLYFATTAWYVHQVLVDISTEIYLQLFVLLALAAKSIEDLGELGSVLAVEWLVSPGLSALLPGFLTFGVEYGFKRLLFDYCPSALSSSLAFTFINKSVSVAMRTTVSENTAEYVNTGRPHANKGYTLKEAFLMFRASHYNSAVAMLGYFFVYTMASERLGSGSSLPMFVINSMGAVWIMAPLLFQPQPKDSYWRQLQDLLHYINGSPRTGIPVASKNTLYEAVMLDEIKAARTRPFTDFVCSLVPSALYFFCLPAIAFDQMFIMVIGISANFCLEFYWPIRCPRPTFVFTILKTGMVIMQVLSPWIDGISDPRLTGLALLAMYTYLKTMKYLFWSVLNVSWYLTCKFTSEGDSVSYDHNVIRISQSFGVMPLHRSAAAIVLVLQAVFASVLWLLEHGSLRTPWKTFGPLRLHTWYLFGWDCKPDNVETMFPEKAMPDAQVTSAYTRDSSAMKDMEDKLKKGEAEEDDESEKQEFVITEQRKVFAQLTWE